MKSNNSTRYRIRLLTYINNELIDDYLDGYIFYNLEQVEFCISLAKQLDRDYFPEYTFIYIIEVL